MSWRANMKIVRFLHPILACVLLISMAGTTANISYKPKAAFFSGKVIGDFQSQYIEFYVNHVEQDGNFPITYDSQGQAVYQITINLGSFPENSNIVFKIDDQVVGFGKLIPERFILDLQLDQQMH
jgi:hypothetical protein